MRCNSIPLLLPFFALTHAAVPKQHEYDCMILRRILART